MKKWGSWIENLFTFDLRMSIIEAFIKLFGNGFQISTENGINDRQKCSFWHQSTTRQWLFCFAACLVLHCVEDWQNYELSCKKDGTLSKLFYERALISFVNLILMLLMWKYYWISQRNQIDILHDILRKSNTSYLRRGINNLFD